MAPAHVCTGRTWDVFSWLSSSPKISAVKMILDISSSLSPSDIAKPLQTMVDPNSSPATAPAVVVPGITLTEMVLRVTGCHRPDEWKGSGGRFNHTSRTIGSPKQAFGRTALDPMDCAKKRPWQGLAERAQRICDLYETQGTQNANTTSEETIQILWDSSSPAISTYTGQLAGKTTANNNGANVSPWGGTKIRNRWFARSLHVLEMYGQAAADCTSKVHGLINRVDRTDIFRKHMPVRLQGDQGTLTGRYSQGNSPRQDRKVFSDQCMTSFLLWQRPELRLVLRNRRILFTRWKSLKRKSPQTILFGHFFISVRKTYSERRMHFMPCMFAVW